jgi:hypothetical protein
LVPRSDAERSLAAVSSLRLAIPVEEAPVPMLLLVEPRPAVEPPAAMLEELPLRPEPADEPPVPIAVLAEPRPAVAPPMPMVDELPEPRPEPAEEPPVPRAALAEPLPAVAAPTPMVEELPEPLRPADDPPVPSAVLALPLPAVDPPAPTVEELCASTTEPPASSIAAAVDINSFLCISLFPVDGQLPSGAPRQRAWPIRVSVPKCVGPL